MDKLFGEYYRLVDLSPTEAKLKKRWTGVERITKGHGAAKVLDLVRLFFGAPTRGAAFLDEFQGAFHDADSSFSMRNNDLELSVLAGSCLKEFFGSNNRRTADLSALATVCAAAGGRGRKPGLPEVLELAAAHLNTRDPVGPELPAPFKLDAGQLKTLTDKITDAGKAASSFTTMAAVIVNFAQHLHKLVGQVGEANSVAMTTLARRLTLQQEETNILWWVFGEHSRDLDCHYSELLEAGAAAVLAGKELADLVEVIPGPVAARAFLHRMIRLAGTTSADDATIAATISGIPPGWHRQVGNQSGLAQISDLCPVLSAIQASCDVPEASAWLPAHEKRTGVAPAATFSATELGMQTYRECLLLKAAPHKS